MEYKHAEIGLTKVEVDTIINGMALILSNEVLDLSNEDKYWYTHIRTLFECFRNAKY